MTESDKSTNSLAAAAPYSKLSTLGLRSSGGIVWGQLVPKLKDRIWVLSVSLMKLHFHGLFSISLIGILFIYGRGESPGSVMMATNRGAMAEASL
jgi:hypothetical protein